MALDSRIVIHANAKVIEMIEQAKFLSDRLIDELPGVFAVIRWDGLILRCNIQLAETLGLAPDQTRERNILSLFSDKDGLAFGQKCHDIGFVAKDSATLELAVPGDRIFKFTIKRYGEAQGEPLLTVLGTDITELRELVHVRN